MTDNFSQAWLKTIIAGICGLVTSDLGIKKMILPPSQFIRFARASR
jgi:hypothetical protein